MERNGIFVASNFKDEFHQDSLEHHGVKGMKWGVRRERQSGIGTSARVREKQARINSRIANTTDKNIVFRNTLNDYRRGRVKALETKAKHREAKEKYKASTDKKSKKETKAELNKARGERLVKNVLLLSGVNPVTSIFRGSYNRYREAGDGKVAAFLKTELKTTPASVAMLAGGAYKNH